MMMKERDDDLIPVISVFSGLGIYRISSLMKYQARYGTPTFPERIGCEHTYFMFKLSPNYINPRLLFIILANEVL